MPRIIPRPAVPVRTRVARADLRFALQFDIGQVAYYADRYAYEEDTAVIAIGAVVRERGYYEFSEFTQVCLWKTQRSKRLVARNAAADVERATRVALAHGTNERDRMTALRSLAGVDYPTASVLLHLPYTERYPILDYRALEALGVPRGTSYYSFRFWQGYVNAWLPLVAQAEVDGRTFDQALWQWSKDNDAGRSAPAHCS